MNPNDPNNHIPQTNGEGSNNYEPQKPAQDMTASQNQPLPQAQPADTIDTPAAQSNVNGPQPNMANPNSTAGQGTNQFQPESQNPMPNTPPTQPGMPGANVMPGYNNVNPASGAMPVPPNNSRSKKIIVIAGSIALASGIAAIIFYFAYWTRSDVVYSRFQSQIAKITTETLNTDIKLLNDINYSLEVESQSTDLPLKAAASGRVVGSGSENTADVTYSGATINLSANTVNNNNSFDLFVKYKGIQKFYDSLLAKKGTSDLASGFSDYLPVLKKYDDKWIAINLADSGLISSGTNETITQDDYNTVRDKLLPIFKDRFIGLKKAGAVITTTNPKSEKVAGKSAWAYELKISNSNYNAMIDEMIKAVDTTKLSDAKKKILKESLDSQKNSFKDSEGNKDGVTVYKIWLEKITGLPLKFSTKTDTKLDGKLLYSDEFVSEITSISAKNIVAKIIVTNKDFAENGSEDASSVFSSNLNVDNKTTKISIDAFYDPDTKKENDKISGKFQLSSASNKAAVTKPATTVTLEQVIKDLNASASQADNTTNSTLDNEFSSKAFANLSKLFTKK